MSSPSVFTFSRQRKREEIWPGWFFLTWGRICVGSLGSEKFVFERKSERVETGKTWMRRCIYFPITGRWSIYYFFIIIFLLLIRLPFPANDAFSCREMKIQFRWSEKKSKSAILSQPRSPLFSLTSLFPFFPALSGCRARLVLSLSPFFLPQQRLLSLIMVQMGTNEATCQAISLNQRLV